MLVNNFTESCSQYENFEIWDVENMDSFLNGNRVISEIFKNDFHMSIEEFDTRREEISKTNMEIMEGILDQIGDKHFFLFTLHSENHLELIQLQAEKIMNFGIDIAEVKGDHVYIVVMDKKKKAVSI